MAWLEQKFNLRVEVSGRRLLNRQLEVKTADVDFLSWDDSTVSQLASSAPADSLLFRSVPSTFVDRLIQSLGSNRHPLIARSYLHYFTAIEGSFDQYLQGFRSKTRSSLQRKVRKFEKSADGELVFRAYKTPTEIRTFFELGKQVSALTYQEKYLDAGLPTDNDYVESAVAEAAQDRARGYCLFSGEQPVSYLYCPSRRGVLEYAYLGYDPAYRKLSPGTVLQFYAFRDLFEEATFSVFDFTEGEGQHKRLFATGSVECADLLLLSKSIRTSLLMARYALLSKLISGVKTSLERLRLDEKVRRLVQRR